MDAVARLVTIWLDSDAYLGAAAADPDGAGE
jgi:hypothetical protein